MRRRYRRWAILVSTGCLCGVAGCWGAVQSSLDLLLSPGALQNSLVLPYRAIGPLANFLIRFLS